MDQSRARHLILGLLGNKLSKEELDEVLCGLENPSVAVEFSNVLRLYFDQLVDGEAVLAKKTRSDTWKRDPL